jgi:Winged helix DNA-binding domain
MPKETTLTRKQIGRATLARQMLLERQAVPVVEAVERLGGLQAQEPRPPFEALWTRLEGFEADELREALAKRRVVRGPLMRATLHIVSAADYRALRPGLQPLMESWMGAYVRGVDRAAVVPAARELLEEEPRTMGELRELLARSFPRDDVRGLTAVARRELALVMVPGDERWGFPRDSRFAPASRWLRRKVAATGDPDALIRRYLGAFGPASVLDFQRWSGLGAAKDAFERLRTELATFRDPRGRELFDLPDAPRPDGDVPAPVRLLPEFDSLVLAHDDRSRVIRDEHRDRIATKNLRIRATFLVDGVVAGTWSAKRGGKRATLTVEPFGRLRKRDAKALEEEGERLLRLVEDDATSFSVKLP